jgi:hypothetical protein
MARGVDAAFHGVADHTAPIEIVFQRCPPPRLRPWLIHREELALNTWAPLAPGLVPQPQPGVAVPHEFGRGLRSFFWLT